MSEAIAGVRSAEELRREGLAKHRAGEIEESIALYDAALPLAADDDLRELITICKADAMIAIEQTGPEVQALAAVVMRRRKPHHTFLAAYALLYKHRLAGDAKRAIFYGNIANDVANDASEPFWRVSALNELGVVYEIDSQFDKAIGCFEAALGVIDAVEDNAAQSFSRVALITNLGYNKIITGATAEGIELMEGVLDQVQGAGPRSDAYVDLCYGYLDLGDYPKARRYGQTALELASEPRQVRNAHYLLGEAAYKMDDTEAAEFHFTELSRFYPEFRNLKHLLFAIDLRSMINLKL
jgi:tetratricopeptide (TPR) repeat protein